MPKNKDGYFCSTFVFGKTVDGEPERANIRIQSLVLYRYAVYKAYLFFIAI